MKEDNISAGGSSEPKTKSATRRPYQFKDGLKILLFSLVLALGVRTFVFEGFRIPTESMEQSLLVGDFVLVSKLHYGPRLPLSIGIPLTTAYFEKLDLPYLRIPGFSSVRRGDAVVFNYPIENGPIDRRTHYIKRMVGMPGDSITIIDKIAYVNGEEILALPSVQQRWVAHTSRDATFPLDSLRAVGATQISFQGRNGRVFFEATAEVANQVERWNEVTSITPYIQPTENARRIFPIGSAFGKDQYGPLYVPAKGDTLELSEETWPFLKEIIQRYEGHTAYRRPDGVIEVDGVEAMTYVVEKDYYFLMGDNRDSSVDSRYWGYVPRDHLVGKAVMIYFSRDYEERRIRWDRVLSIIT